LSKKIQNSQFTQQ
jgi:hypothetical protein